MVVKDDITEPRAKSVQSVPVLCRRSDSVCLLRYVTL